MTDPDFFLTCLHKIAAGECLSAEDSHQAFNEIMSGDISAAQLGAFLMGLKQRGETVDELTGAANALLDKMIGISAPTGAIDTCGTGGDGLHTLNISTIVGLVVAACGVPVAKHGNRSVSSKCGAADILEELGVDLTLSPQQSEQMLKEVGFAFLMAPNHHPAMKNVAPVRGQLKMRTIFNLLGPLVNPARVKHQLVGVYAKEWLEPMARVLQRLGSTSAWVVHGHDGMDEITTTGPTYVAQLKDDEITRFEIAPDDYGLFLAQADAIKGGDAPENAAAAMALLDGEEGPYRNIVLLNSAAALVIAGHAKDLREGLDWAKRAIDNGGAKSILTKLSNFSKAA